MTQSTSSPPFATRRLIRSIALLLALIVFLAFLGRTPIVADHELRVTETATTMARSGWPWAATPITVPLPASVGGTATVNPWLVPVFQNQIRLQKPPLPYWIAAISFRLFGEGSGVARFAPALMGAVASLLVYQLGRRVGGRRVARVAFLAWISTYFIIDEHRKVMADPYLSFFTLAAVVAWIEAAHAIRFRSVLMLAFYLSLALGCIAKGPVALMHVAFAIIAYSYCFRRWPRVGIWWHVLGLVGWLTIVLPWPIYVETHVPGAVEVWRYESLGEFADNKRNARPFLFYLPAVLLIAAPWTVAWIGSVVVVIAKRSRRRAFPLLWLAATVIVFSFVHMKKNAYMLPVAPAIVIAAAQAAVRGIAFARRHVRPDQVKTMALGHTIAGLVVAGVVVWMSYSQRAIGPGLVPAIVVSAIAVLAALLPLLLRPANFGRWLVVQAFAFSVVIFLFVAFPQADKRLQSHTADAEPASQPTTAPTTTLATS